ncbi:malonate decarboxylase subunit beta [Serratia rubidaea]|uniref:Malonate decarboxylase subunit beta n=2 Tax=Serratia rubidaea TaxID=61652 RepID=A0A4V6JI49_SERRU|nr:malonate decarboxylase subunit beta [Serratia rubidaea]
MTGGDVRYRSGFADVEVEDALHQVRVALLACLARGVPARHRSERHDYYLSKLTQFDSRQQADAAVVAQLFAREERP